MERKEKILRMLKEDESIDNDSIYDLLYLLYFHMALMQSTEDFINGNVLTIEESKELIRKQHANFYI